MSKPNPDATHTYDPNPTPSYAREPEHVMLVTATEEEHALLRALREHPNLRRSVMVLVAKAEKQRVDLVLSAESAQSLMYPHVAGSQYEKLVLLVLDRKGRPLLNKVLTVGHTGATIVDNAQILGEVLRAGGTSFILAHNHPSGDREPSAEDKVVTRRLWNAAQMVGVRFVDHLILTDSGGYYSMAANGELG